MSRYVLLSKLKLEEIDMSVPGALDPVFLWQWHVHRHKHSEGGLNINININKGRIVYGMGMQHAAQYTTATGPRARALLCVSTQPCASVLSACKVAP